MSGSTIVEFPQVTEDFISDLKYIPEDNTVIVSSWDGTLSVYKVNQNNGQYTITLNNRYNAKFPILSVGYSHEGIYVGGVEGELAFFDKISETFTLVEGNKATSGIIRIQPYYNDFIAGSWDGSLQVIEHITHTVKSVNQIENAKILSMDCSNEHLVVATTGNKIVIYKLPLSPLNKGTLIDSGLQYQIRDIKLIPDGSGYVIGSIDGRVAVEYFTDASKQFAFRCHRMILKDVQLVYPVNSLHFGQNSDHLFTGGSDGCVSCWTLKNRKKVKQNFSKITDESVVKMVGDDKLLFVASSDDSFKTSAVITDDLDLLPSNVYMIVLDK